MRKLIGALAVGFISFCGAAKADVSPYFVQVPISVDAIAADPSLANYQCWDLRVDVTGSGVSQSGEDRFTTAVLYCQLSPGSFYSPVGGGDEPVAAGAANLAYDTYINVPLYQPGTTDPLFAVLGQADGHGVGPAIFPEAGGQQSLLSVAWGSLHTESQNGDYDIAQLTVSDDAVGGVDGFVMSTSQVSDEVPATTQFGLSARFNAGALAVAFVPEPVSLGILLPIGAMLIRRRR